MVDNRISFEKYSIGRGCEDVDDETLRPIGEQMLAALKLHGLFCLTDSGFDHEVVSSKFILSFKFTEGH